MLASTILDANQLYIYPWGRYIIYRAELNRLEVNKRVITIGLYIRNPEDVGVDYKLFFSPSVVRVRKSSQASRFNAKDDMTRADKVCGPRSRIRTSKHGASINALFCIDDRGREDRHETNPVL
jgi:hypothetical protein